LLPVLPNRILAAALLPAAALWAASCAAPLGPGYTVERQGVAIDFVPGPEPRIAIHAEYRLRKTGKKPLEELDVRLPRESVVRLEGVSVTWEGRPGLMERRSDPDGDILHLKMNAPWPVKRTRTLHLEYYVVRGDPATSQLDVAPDGFYLPVDGWLAAPVPPAGTLGSVGAPPKEWNLSVRVPADFLVRASGELKRPEKNSRGGVIEFTQQARGVAPYVVAGRYFQQEYRGSSGTVYIWKKTKFDKVEAESLANAVHKIAAAYDATFGPRDTVPRSLWIADSPVPVKHSREVTERGHADGAALHPPPPDFGFLYDEPSGKPVLTLAANLRMISGDLARTWMGYGRNPRFEALLPPLGELPLYAAAVAEESLEGTNARTSRIVEAIGDYDRAQEADAAEKSRASKKELGVFTDEFVYRSKSLLFFFALEDQFGRENVHRALHDVVQARKGRGYNLNDLIAALETNTHQNAAEFVRLWRKHPGIPGEFRARYAGQLAPATASSKETKP
jgi:hypothetical protein